MLCRDAKELLAPVKKMSVSVIPLETIVAEYVTLKTERFHLVNYLEASPGLSEIYQVIQRHAAGSMPHPEVGSHTESEKTAAPCTQLSKCMCLAPLPGGFTHLDKSKKSLCD